MEKKKLKSRILAVALMLTVTFTMLKYSFQDVDAAVAIDVNRKCSVTWTVDETSDSKEFAADLKKISVNVNLYKIADVDSGQHYQTLEAFNGLQLNEMLAKADATTEDWEKMAGDAQAIVKAQSVASSKTGAMANGSLKLGDLPVGVYLVSMDPAKSAEYEYTFEPYLIALPGNTYFSDNQTDDWLYDIDASVKATREPRYGSIEIIKDLQSYAELLGEVSFVFQVEGTKDDLVYSNVVAITFSSAEKKSVVLDHIPAGMKVTVTEIYSGVSYEATSATVKDATIIADGEEGAPVQVEFSNKYTDKLIPGSGVTNMFNYDGDEWQWNTDDNLPVL